jgi:hypothetical protein
MQSRYHLERQTPSLALTAGQIAAVYTGHKAREKPAEVV